MYAVAYRWKIEPGKEGQFALAWAAGTTAISEEFNGWGSRLHAGDDGYFYAYAQWPDKTTYDEAMESRMHHSDDEARNAYRDAIMEDGFEVMFAGEMISDLLKPLDDPAD